MSWIGNIIKKVFKNEGLKQPESKKEKFEKYDKKTIRVIR